MTVSYEDAVREVEGILKWFPEGCLPDALHISTDAIRALLSGPPVPSEEEVARVIDPRAWERLDVERKHYPADPLERFTTVPDVAVSIMRAQAVLALFRSRING